MTISTQRLRFLRGNTAASSAFTGLGGELIVDTELNTIRVQDGYTPGGTLLATAAQLANVSGNYGNANVAAYLPTYSGNLTAGNILSNNYLYANGVNILTGIQSNYGNSNVASYLTTYNGAIKASSITTDGADLTLTTGLSDWIFDETGVLTAPGEINTPGNVSAYYFIGDGSQLTGLPATYSNANVAAYLLANPQPGTYSNANVAAYLPSYGGNIALNAITAASNLTATISPNNSFNVVMKITDIPGNPTFSIRPDRIVMPDGNGTIETAGEVWNLDGGNHEFSFPNGARINYGALNGGTSANDISLQPNSTGSIVVRTGGSNDWIFHNSGALTFPNGSLSIEHGMGDQIQSTDNLFVSAASMTLSGTDGSSLSQIYLANDGNIRLRSNFNNGTDQYWDFSANGILTLPSGGQIGALQPGAGAGIDLYAPDSLAYTQINYNNTNYIYADPGVSQLQTPNVNIIAHTLNKYARIQVADPDNTLDKSWYFYANGSIEFPDSTIQSTAFNNGTLDAGLTTLLPSQLSTYTGNLTAGNLTVTGNIVMTNGGNITQQNFYGNTGNFYGDPTTGFGAFYAGKTGFTQIPQTLAQMSASYNGYAQVNLENQSAGNQATADYIVTADNGTDTTYYVDLGIAGSGYNGLLPNNSLGTSLNPNDAYLYAQGNGNANVGGNLVIGTTTDSKTIKFISGGINSEHIAVEINHPGNTNTLTVTGGVTASNVTSSYFIGNGALLTNVAATSATYVTGLTSANVTTALGYTPSNYSNTNVAAYLPTYTGNISFGNLTLSSNSSNIVFTNGATIYGDAGALNRNGSIVLQPAASGTFPSVVIGGAGRLAAPNGSVHQIFNSNDVTFQVAVKNITGIPATSTTTGALQITGGAGISGNVYAGGNVVATGNVTGTYFVGNGALLTGITASSSYGNTNVAAYLASNGAVPITTTSNITASYYIGNGSLLTGITANTTYSNTNVASYLLGNITVGNISGTDPNVTLVANTYSYVFSNIGNVSFPGNLTVTANTSVGNIFATGYYYANGAAFTGTGGGSSNYSNTNVAAYLTGSISTGAITTSGNIYGSVSYNQPNFIQPNSSDAGWAFGTYTDGASEFWMQTKFFGLNQPTRGFRVYEAEGASTVFSVNGSGDAVVSNSLETSTIKAPFFTGTGTIGSGRRITLDPDNNTVNYIRIDGDDGGAERLVISSQLSTSSGVYFYLRNGNVFRMADNQLMYPDSTWQSTAYPGTSTDLSLAGNVSGGNLIASGNVTGTYFVGNGALLTGITATANYNDSNVSSFLSNIGSNTIVTTGNVTAGYFLGNGALLTGIVASGSTYSNTNVAAFLSNIGSNSIVTTGNVTASYFLGNGALLTGITSYSNANVVSMLAANANLAIGNVGTAYTTASNVTTLFVGNSTTVASGGSGSGSGQTSLLNNLYYDATSALRYRNTQTGATSLTMGGSGGFSFAGTTGGVTANAASGMSIWATLNGSALQTYNSIGVTSAGALTTTSGVLTTGAAVSTVFNTVATTVNMGGAATSIALGASTATVTIGSGTGNLTVGNITVGSISNNLNVIGNLTVSSVIASGSGTYTGNVTAGNLSTPGTGGNISGVNIVFGNVVGSGNSTVQDFTVNSSATVGGTLGVTGAAVFAGNVTINGPIAGYAPARPAVRLYGNTSTNWTAGTTISNQVVDYNQGSYYSNSTGLFTAPVAGLYHCYATVRVGNNNALNQAALLKNGGTGGANVVAFWETDTNTGTASHFSITGYAKCVAGDTLSLKVIAGNVQFDSNDSWGVTYIG